LQLSAGLNRIELVMKTNQLAVGSYMISLDITEPFVRYFGRFENILSFEVEANQGTSSDRSILQSWGYGSYVLDIFKAN
jgi:lipopolysaccharide transport system ATP-binding protein